MENMEVIPKVTEQRAIPKRDGCYSKTNKRQTKNLCESHTTEYSSKEKVSHSTKSSAKVFYKTACQSQIWQSHEPQSPNLTSFLNPFRR